MLARNLDPHHKVWLHDFQVLRRKNLYQTSRPGESAPPRAHTADQQRQHEPLHALLHLERRILQVILKETLKETSSQHGQKSILTDRYLFLYILLVHSHQGRLRRTWFSPGKQTQEMEDRSQKRLRVALCCSLTLCLFCYVGSSGSTLNSSNLEETDDPGSNSPGLVSRAAAAVKKFMHFELTAVEKKDPLAEIQGGVLKTNAKLSLADAATFVAERQAMRQQALHTQSQLSHASVTSSIGTKLTGGKYFNRETRQPVSRVDRASAMTHLRTKWEAERGAAGVLNTGGARASAAARIRAKWEDEREGERAAARGQSEPRESINQRNTLTTAQDVGRSYASEAHARPTGYWAPASRSSSPTRELEYSPHPLDHNTRASRPEASEEYARQSTHRQALENTRAIRQEASEEYARARPDEEQEPSRRPEASTHEWAQQGERGIPTQEWVQQGERRSPERGSLTQEWAQQGVSRGAARGSPERGSPTQEWAHEGERGGARPVARRVEPEGEWIEPGARVHPIQMGNEVLGRSTARNSRAGPVNPQHAPEWARRAGGDGARVRMHDISHSESAAPTMGTYRAAGAYGGAGRGAESRVQDPHTQYARVDGPWAMQQRAPEYAPEPVRGYRQPESATRGEQGVHAPGYARTRGYRSALYAQAPVHEAAAGFESGGLRYRVAGGRGGVDRGMGTRPALPMEMPAVYTQGAVAERSTVSTQASGPDQSAVAVPDVYTQTAPVATAAAPVALSHAFMRHVYTARPHVYTAPVASPQVYTQAAGTDRGGYQAEPEVETRPGPLAVGPEGETRPAVAAIQPEMPLAQRLGNTGEKPSFGFWWCFWLRR